MRLNTSRRFRVALMCALLSAGVCVAVAAYAAPALPFALRPQAATAEYPPHYLPLIASATHMKLPKGPDVIFTGDNTEMRVVWQLTATLSAQLRWGTDSAYSAGSVTTREYTPDHMHAHTIAGLTPGLKYYYRVTAGNADAVGSFTAAPAPSASLLKFVVYGDTRTYPATHDAVAGDIVATYHADHAYQTLALMTGDLVSAGDSEASWSGEFFDPRYANIRAVLANVAVLPIIGNHEQSGVLFAKYFPMPFVAGRYWSFNYGPIHVAMLDQYTDYAAGSPQYSWLQNDLAGSDKIWKFVVLHEPGWSAGGGHANNTTVQNDLQPLAVEYGVSFVLGGHNHYYARAVVDGVQHLTVGTGGAPLVVPDPSYPYVVTTDMSHGFTRFAIDGHTLTMTAVRLDGSVVESITLTR